MQCKQKILAVDDNPMNNDIVVETLEDEFHLQVAGSGEEALAIATSFCPDIVLLDIMMPGIDGYETCRRLRANDATATCKIIMLSAKAMTSERLKGYDAGADDYLTKPFEPEELLSKVRVYSRLRSAEEVDQLKNVVLGFIGHETRTPLTAILSATDILLSGEDITGEQLTTMATMLKRNATRLRSLVEKVLLLSALRSGQRPSALASIDLWPVVQGAINDVTARTSAQNIVIDNQISGRFSVWADSEQVGLVIAAILENAARFSPADETITVTIFDKIEAIQLQVHNRGDVIDAELLPQIFEPFSDSDFKHHGEGQGLSLAIAQRIVHQHNGQLFVESSADNGTTFTVQLRKASQLSEVTCA